MKHVPHKKLVLFDIDGTLLYSTSVKLRERFSHAIFQLHGKKTEVDWDLLEGATDNTILMSLLNKTGVDIKEDKNALLLPLHEKAYEYFSLTVDETYSSTILPGAKTILENLTRKVHLGVLTGNYEKTGWKKLELIGLRHYFEFGLFGHEADDRNQLAMAVFDKAKLHYGNDIDPRDIIIIGDTPRDIECARTIQAHCISVASGKYSIEELNKLKPDLLISSLEDKRILEYIFEV